MACPCCGSCCVIPCVSPCCNYRLKVVRQCDTNSPRTFTDLYPLTFTDCVSQTIIVNSPCYSPTSCRFPALVNKQCRTAIRVIANCGGYVDPASGNRCGASCQFEIQYATVAFLDPGIAFGPWSSNIDQTGCECLSYTGPLDNDLGTGSITYTFTVEPVPSASQTVLCGSGEPAAQQPNWPTCLPGSSPSCSTASAKQCPRPCADGTNDPCKCFPAAPFNGTCPPGQSLKPIGYCGCPCPCQSNSFAPSDPPNFGLCAPATINVTVSHPLMSGSRTIVIPTPPGGNASPYGSDFVGLCGGIYYLSGMSRDFPFPWVFNINFGGYGPKGECGMFATIHSSGATPSSSYFVPFTEPECDGTQRPCLKTGSFQNLGPTSNFGGQADTTLSVS